MYKLSFALNMNSDIKDFIISVYKKLNEAESLNIIFIAANKTLKLS